MQVVPQWQPVHRRDPLLGGQARASKKSKTPTDHPSCNEEELSELPNMVVPVRNTIGKRVKSFGSLSDLPALARETMEAPPAYSSESEESEDTIVQYDQRETPRRQSLVEKMLLQSWDEKSDKGLFKYLPSSCPSKLVPGRFEFVAQLNVGRATKKRQTEFRMDNVCQEFDAKKFNFTKARQDEVLFQFELSADDFTSCYEEQKIVESNASFVYINISPIEYGHVLLVPKVLQCIPQQMSTECLLTAIHMSVEVHNPCFKIGFNTLGAYASINHLHFQGYFLNVPFPVERVETEYLPGYADKTDKELRVSKLLEYPVRCFVFELGSDPHELAKEVSMACNVLERQNIPYNLLIVDCGARVFLFPNKFDENKQKKVIPEDVLDTQVNPACFEIGGHMVMKREEDYKHVSEGKIFELLSYASLSEEEFAKVEQDLFSAAAENDSGVVESN
mmetsp:Transcript_9541/g.23752  ORF Transcript_9541/g.23752 Transcript_9541/m.23752 type:complete len:448 (+) Transcript_9541:364-1707(+)